MPDRKVHPFAETFPMLPADELDDLAADIQSNGLKHPLVRDTEGQLIDGRNRLAACEMVGVTPTYTTLPADEDPVLYILSVNVWRRHLGKGAKAMAVAKARLLIISKPSQAKAAAVAKVSQQYVSDAHVVIQYAPELVDAVMAGGSLLDAYTRARAVKDERESQEVKRAQLRLKHPELDDQVTSGDLTLGQALAALDAIDAAARHEAELARITQAVALRAEEVGPAVPLPDPPDLTVQVSAEEVAGPAMAALTDDDSLARAKAVDAYGRRLVTVKNQLKALTESPPPPPSGWFDSVTMPMVQAWASQMVTLVYAVVEANEAQVPRIRRVQ